MWLQFWTVLVHRAMTNWPHPCLFAERRMRTLGPASNILGFCWFWHFSRKISLDMMTHLNGIQRNILQIFQSHANECERNWNFNAQRKWIKWLISEYKSVVANTSQWLRLFGCLARTEGIPCVLRMENGNFQVWFGATVATWPKFCVPLNTGRTHQS